VQTSATNPAVPPLTITPATTLNAAYGMSEADILALLNRYPDLGKTFTAADLTADPVQALAELPYSELQPAQLAVLRAYLVLYGVNSMMNSVQSLKVTEDFTSEVQLEASTT